MEPSDTTVEHSLTRVEHCNTTLVYGDTTVEHCKITMEQYEITVMQCDTTVEHMTPQWSTVTEYEIGRASCRERV